MRGTIVNTILFIIVIALFSLHWVLRSDPSRRNIEVMPDMAQSPAYASFGANQNFRDGMTLRGPVPRTVVRGRMPLHYVATPADALRAGRELRSPFAPNDAKVLARGKFVFETYCMTCHGVHGTGDGTVAQRGYPTPASLLAPRAVQMADGQLFHVLTYGQNNMPSYAAQVGREDRWRVIAYVRSLQGRRP
jgi:mono/diheme cytochrome c family protein